jgi:hypothetical protein
MTLNIHQDYRLALPVFKVGHIIKAGGGSKGGSGFWVITQVMEGRIYITETGVITKKKWVAASGDSYKQVSGNLDTQRIVHLQYLAAVNQANSVLMYWMNNPLFNPETDSTINSSIAPDANPLRLDKWSYDQSMFIGVSITTAVSQDMIIEAVTYVVEEYSGDKPSKYLEITAQGNALFVEKGVKKPFTGEA